MARPRTSSGLAAAAALCTAGASLLAGVTTTGMIARVAVAATGFWTVGLVLDNVLWWAMGGNGVGGRASAMPGQGGKGQRLDVRLPAVAPRSENR